MSPRIVLIIFARAPIPGRCKTRLARSIGARRAASLYRQLMLRTVQAAIDSRLGPVQIWLAERPLYPVFSSLRQQAGVSLHVQRRGTLGQRMDQALDSALRSGAQAAILCGTDAIDLESEDFSSAADLLAGNANLVLQPSGDGGFVLIGVNRAAGGAMSAGIEWSSGREMTQTRRQFQRRGFTCLELRQRLDLDEASDLRRARFRGLL